MIETAPTRRRSFQFSVRTMLALISAIAIVVFAISEHRERVRLEGSLQRTKSALDELRKREAGITRREHELEEVSRLRRAHELQTVD
jgi:hypothetical protein